MKENKYKFLDSIIWQVFVLTFVPSVLVYALIRNKYNSVVKGFIAFILCIFISVSFYNSTNELFTKLIFGENEIEFVNPKPAEKIAGKASEYFDINYEILQMETKLKDKDKQIEQLKEKLNNKKDN